MMPVIPISAGGKRPVTAFSIDSLMGRDSVAAAVPAKASNPAAISGMAYSSFGHTLLKNIYESHYLESLGFAGHLGINPAFAGALPPSALPGHPSAGSVPSFNPVLFGAAQARAADHLLLNPWLLPRHGGGYFGPRFGPADHSLLLQPFRKPKRIRTAFSPSQLLKLEQSFEKNHYVVGQERKDLATSLGLSETQVKVWFQNRRTKHKRTKSDGTIENDREDNLSESAEEDVCADDNDPESDAEGAEVEEPLPEKRQKVLACEEDTPSSSAAS